MELRPIIERARLSRGWSLRRLAHEAGTSHATLSAYSHRRVDPAVATIDRVVGTAGLAIEPTLVRRIALPDRGRELADVLELAAAFPARHEATLQAPVFGPAGDRGAR